MLQRCCSFFCLQTGLQLLLLDWPSVCIISSSTTFCRRYFFSFGLLGTLLLLPFLLVFSSLSLQYFSFHNFLILFLLLSFFPRAKRTPSEQCAFHLLPFHCAISFYYFITLRSILFSFSTPSTLSIFCILPLLISSYPLSLITVSSLGACIGPFLPTSPNHLLAFILLKFETRLEFQRR